MIRCAKCGAEVVLPAVRSSSQNRYYHLYLGVIERETGQSADEIHEWAKWKFLPPRFVTLNGEETRIAGTTKSLGKAEFGDYLDKISAETGVPLPDPQAAGFITNY